jgi:hypothetical protein
MIFKAALTIVAFLSLAIIPAEMLNSQHVAAFQPPQKEKKEAQPETQTPRQVDKESSDSLEDAFPALCKVKPVAKDDDELRKLLVERFGVAVVEVKVRHLQYQEGAWGSLYVLLGAYQHILDSRLELVEKPEEEIAVREDFLKIVKEMETTTKVGLESGKTNLGGIC